MNNLERAKRLLGCWVDHFGGLESFVDEHGGSLDGLAEALKDAGLLMPDLPELDSEGGWAEGWASVEIDSEGFIYMDIPPRPHHPERARRIAYGILAASAETERGIK